jgi:DNA-binding HxlR family transcriptional regulator
MEGYGQFCPLALSAEVVGERWTPLVVREMMMGARHFNDIHRGVPRMSPSLLSRRLKTLQDARIVERVRKDRRIEYHLTEAGHALVPVIEALAVWGKTWLPSTLSAERADPDLILWDMHRRMATDRMPAHRIVIQFDFTDQQPEKRLRWLIGEHGAIDMCITNPGLEVDLFVETDSQTVTLVWYGDMALRHALEGGQIELHGPRNLCDAFPSWIKLNVLAEVQRRNGPVRRV